MDKKVKHFVLVHGAGHGAWCWYKVATELRAAGHRVTGLDMAASGVHPKQVYELRSMSDYFQPLMEFMESLLDDQVVLVGHSFGGVSISVAMERYPNKIVEAVFVTAVMIGPHLNLPDVTHQVVLALYYHVTMTLSQKSGVREKEMSGAEVFCEEVMVRISGSIST